MLTEFDRQRDQPQVAQILHAGCTHMLEAFELEDVDIDDLIATAMDDPQAIAGTKVRPRGSSPLGSGRERWRAI